MLKKLLGTTVLFVMGFLPCFALYNRQGIPDSAEIRQKLVDSWFTAPLEKVCQNEPEIYVNNIGRSFQVRVEEFSDEILVIVAPSKKIELDIISGTVKTATKVDIYPADIPGSWVLHRNSATGEPLYIEYFFAPDPEVVLRIRPSGQKALADLLIFGSYVVQGVPLGVNFENLYKSSLFEVLDLTHDSLPWSYVDVEPELYHSVLQMIAVIRENLPRVKIVEDACYNEDGEPIYVSTGKKRIVPQEEIEEDTLSLNSLGFVKWIADGLIEPLSGSNTLWKPLTVSTVELRQGGYADHLNTTVANMNLSLDWTRNLAAAVLSVSSGRNYYYNTSGCDVTVSPFSSRLVGKNKKINALGYLQDTGYQIKDIKPLLYVLAATEPGRMFFGAIREHDTDLQDVPEVHYYSEAVAIFPYFNTAGQFEVVIFQNGKEVPLEFFINQYKDAYLHLVRVNTSEIFYLQ